MGANPKKKGTWAPLFKFVYERLSTWGNRFVSLGGRLVLSSLVLNSIPVFFLSFMKMCVSVWKKLVSMQRHFLLGGFKG